MIDRDLFARLMSLPPGARTDLLEFLGASPESDDQLEQLITGLGAAIEEKRKRRANAPN